MKQFHLTNCASVDMTAWQYALVKDTYSSTPTPADLAALTFDGTGASVDGTIGSFKRWYLSPALNGPDEIHNNPEMILVIKNDISYLVL